jgi:hypothetical protein
MARTDGGSGFDLNQFGQLSCVLSWSRRFSAGDQEGDHAMSQSRGTAGSSSDRSFARRLLGFADAVVEHGVDWVKDWHFAEEHRQYLAEIERTGQLTSFLETVGLTAEQLQACEVSPLAAAELMAGMMERLGIPAVDAAGNPLGLGDAGAHCRLCTNWRRCRRWLDHGVDAEEYREFCANAARFDRLRHLAAEAL